MVSFTGSTAAGRRVSAVAAQTVKRVSLKLGGKSANIILDDTDLQTAVVHGVGKCFVNSGQTCIALTRMLVPRTRLAEAEQIAAAAASAYTVGDPFDEATTLGPVVSQTQLERVRGYIETARSGCAAAARAAGRRRRGRGAGG
jgi:aldehyde dehydrogenase (NAD+)